MDRRRFNQSSGNSNYEATSYSKKVEKFTWQSLLHQEVYPWLSINQFDFYEVTKERTRL